ncbi:hypothetical protein Goklo_028551, partial [Gossypium klotzschianum]|nr:hypothetical protein [Gossypium klotzschianum]
VKRWTFLISIARIDVSGILINSLGAFILNTRTVGLMFSVRFPNAGCIICGNKDSINQKTVFLCSINRRVCSCSNAVARPTVPIPSSGAWLIHCQRVWLMHGVCAFVLAFERGGNSKILRRRN